MSEPGRLDLASPREIRALLGIAVQIYLRHFPAVFAIAVAVVAPVQLIVSGIGMEDLTSAYRDSPTAAETVLPTVVSFLVVAPLIAAAAIDVLRRLEAGERPHAGHSIQAALDVFAPVFLAVVLAAAAIAAGLAAFVVPGVFLAIRLYLVPQAVVVHGARGLDALRRSWELTRGSWWRTFAVVLLANLAVLLPGLLVLAPIQSLAESADRQWIALAGSIAAESLTAPFIALASTLLFFDLTARKAATPATP